MIDKHAVAVVQQACRLLEADTENMPTLRELARELGVPPARLHRAFLRIAGVSPREYARAHRVGKLKKKLRAGQPVTHAIYDAGFGSSRSVYENARAEFGMTPARYRRGGSGVRIGYEIVDSPLGRLLVGATQHGVSAVCIGDADRKLEQSLRSEYPGADIERGGPHLRGYIERILAFLRGKEPHLDLPVDIQATAFQRKVWEALRAIPYGQTRSYGEIAAGIGEPKAARAVGQACGANPVALVIPCHRAVRGDGASGGYRWGSARKAKILATERASRRS